MKACTPSSKSGRCPDDLSAAIVAFANTDGGKLVLGISDAGQVVGLADPDAVMRTVDNVARNNCLPPVPILQEKLAAADGKEVLAVSVAKGDERPYATNRGVHFVRTASGRRQASRQEILRLFLAAESFYFDEAVVSRAQVADLDFRAFEHYLRTNEIEDTGLEVPDLMRNWMLLQDDHPTLAGLLLFGRNPQQFFHYAQIHACRWRGTDVDEGPLDMKIFDRSLFDQIEGAEKFLYLHLPVRHEIRGFEPERKPELPESALREAVVNAVAHRDYTIRAPIRVFVFDDRVEIRSPGPPPNSINLDNVRTGVHVPRNPVLYSRLAEAGLTTRAGGGVRRLIRAVKRTTGLDVRLEIIAFEFVLTVPRPVKTSGEATANARQ